VWLAGEIKTPPFTREARIETGVLLRALQQGESLGLPHSRPMPSIGPRCHELRVRDEAHNWRIFYHLTTESVVILDVQHKTTPGTPGSVIENCRRRLKTHQSLP
jgi:phage-related protein